MIPSFLVRDRDRIVATHVCRHWRDTFLSTPTLWDAIAVSHSPDKTVAYLERSGDTTLNISIMTNGPESSGWTTSFRMLGQHAHRYGTLRLYEHHYPGGGVFTIMDNHFPRLTELELEIPYGVAFGRIEGPHPFPPLKSLILRGDMTCIRGFQPHSLRKLGVSCVGQGFQLPSLLEFLAQAQLLEELKFEVDQCTFAVAELGQDVPPVPIEGLQRIVFRGTLPQSLRSLTSHIVHPHGTKIVLACHLPGTYGYPGSYPFPRGAQLPIPAPPKYIRCRLVHDEDLSESYARIDLISTDGRHTLIENRFTWYGDRSLSEAESLAADELNAPCLKFLQTIDLSSVERLCFERFNPDPHDVENLAALMDKLETLVVVDVNPRPIFKWLTSPRPREVICPLLRRLIIRCDLNRPYIPWGNLVEIIGTRASLGSPIERVTLTSSFSGLLEGHTSSKLLEEIAEVTYDLGRNTFGWEWWKE